jgi:hypothetical protein
MLAFISLAQAMPNKLMLTCKAPMLSKLHAAPLCLQQHCLAHASAAPEAWTRTYIRACL